MARFQISESSRYDNPNFDIDGEHRKFHEVIQALKTELSEKAGPSAVTRAQVDSVLVAFDGVKRDFFRCRNSDHATERLRGSMRALNAGTSFKPGSTKDGLVDLWLEQRKLAELLLHETLKVGRGLKGISVRVENLCGSMAARLHQGVVTKADMKDSLSILWQDVLKRVVAEFGIYR